MLTLAMTAALSSNAFIWAPYSTYDLFTPRWPSYELSSYDVQREVSRCARTEFLRNPSRPPQQPSPYSTTDAYELKMRLPDLEPESVTASLASDGNKIELGRAASDAPLLAIRPTLPTDDAPAAQRKLKR